MYPTKFIVDIETDGLDKIVNRITCICMCNCEKTLITEEIYEFNSG